MNKADRIHHDKRIKARVAHYCTAGDRSPRAIGIAARTRQMCSCWVCGNQRKIEGDKARDKAMKQRKLFEGWDG